MATRPSSHARVTSLKSDKHQWRSKAMIGLRSDKKRIISALWPRLKWSETFSSCRAHLLPTSSKFNHSTRPQHILHFLLFHCRTLVQIEYSHSSAFMPKVPPLNLCHWQNPDGVGQIQREQQLYEMLSKIVQCLYINLRTWNSKSSVFEGSPCIEMILLEFEILDIVSSGKAGYWRLRCGGLIKPSKETLCRFCTRLIWRKSSTHMYCIYLSCFFFFNTHFLALNS